MTPASSSRSAGLEAIPTTTRPDGTAYQPIEWARVVLAARVHGDASVSSPTLRFCQPGTTLQVVNRQNGWVQITDPTSGEGGWVFEQYLVPADGPTATQTAMVTTASQPAAEPTASQKSEWERLGFEHQTSSLLRNSTGGGSGALHAAAAYFSSAASRELSEAAGDPTNKSQSSAFHTNQIPEVAAPCQPALHKGHNAGRSSFCVSKGTAKHA